VSKEIPSRTSVVVIGGGAVGCSVLYHLAKSGLSDCVLLERNQLTSGTTWHAAALVSPLRSSAALTEMAKYSARLYASLEAETGQSTGWRAPGHLNVAATEARLEQIRQAATLSRTFGIEVEMIGPAEAKKLHPLMRTDDLKAALYTPHSGRVDPSGICQAMAKGAKAAGARIFEEMPVTGFLREGDRVVGVATPFGEIRCDAVVNCAGLWGRQVAGMAGLAAPMFACEHFYLLTEPIPGMSADFPMVRDGDAYLYIREDVGGLLVGCFEPNPKPLSLERLPRDQAFMLLDEDWEHFEPMMAGAINRFPALESAGVRTLLNGPESFTLDNNPLMGEAPGVQGFYFACAMNSAGIALAGGVGQVMAEWILKGRPNADLWPADVRRFARIQDNTRTLVQRIPEVLAKHFDVNYPGQDYETARGVRRSPIYAEQQRRGAWFLQTGGWERPAFYRQDDKQTLPFRFGKPAWFEEWAGEHRAAREAVALFDQTSFGKLMITGADAESFLQRVCANDMAVPPGRVVYTSILNEAGGIESDLTVTRLAGDRYLAVTGTLQTVRDLDWLTKSRREGEHVSIIDVTSAWAVLGLHGPRSRALLERLSEADWANEKFPFGTAREVEVGPGVALAVRISYPGELGWELYVPTELAAAVYEAIVDTGAEFGLRHAGTLAMGSLRMEKLFRSWGHDIGPTVTPLEAGLAFSVALGKKQPFVGKDALLRQKEAGVTRRLVGFTFNDEEAFPLGTHPVFRHGALVGETTSVSYGHTLGRAVALGWIRGPELSRDAILSDVFEIEIAGVRYRATACLAPPYDPKGSRMRS